MRAPDGRSSVKVIGSQGSQRIGRRSGSRAMKRNACASPAADVAGVAGAGAGDAGGGVDVRVGSRRADRRGDRRLFAAEVAIATPTAPTASDTKSRSATGHRDLRRVGGGRSGLAGTGPDTRDGSPAEAGTTLRSRPRCPARDERPRLPHRAGVPDGLDVLDRVVVVQDQIGPHARMPPDRRRGPGAGRRRSRSPPPSHPAAACPRPPGGPVRSARCRAGLNGVPASVLQT